VTPHCVTVLPLLYHCVSSVSAHILPLTPWVASLSFHLFWWNKKGLRAKASVGPRSRRLVALFLSAQSVKRGHLCSFRRCLRKKLHTPLSFLKYSTLLSPTFFVFSSLSSDLSTNLTPSYSNMLVRACLPLIRWITLHSSAVGEHEAIVWGVRAVSPRLGACFCEYFLLRSDAQLVSILTLTLSD